MATAPLEPDVPPPPAAEPTRAGLIPGARVRPQRGVPRRDGSAAPPGAPVVESVRAMTPARLAIGAALYPPVDDARPRAWGECVARGLGTAEDPCPYAGCRHHLALEVGPHYGALTYNWPDRAPDAPAPTCALRVAHEGPHTLAEVGALLNVGRERVRQVERDALRKLRRACRVAGLDLGALLPTPLEEPTDYGEGTAGGEGP